jgi:hypothetical protein
MPKGIFLRKPKEITWAINERGCWICTSHPRDKDGYTTKWVNGTNKKIHRLMYELHRGIIPPNMCVCHVCDEPACINPSHLWLGTKDDNMHDRDKKGRTTCGEKHHSAKLTGSQVLEIRSISDTQQEIAKKYGIAQNTVSKIKKRKTWKHLP